MRLAFGIIAIIALVGLHLAALFELLHPKFSREYKAYYVDRVSMDWHEQHYHSDPEEGIDFSRLGWPDFVEYSFGIARPEGFGRWTDTRMGLNAGFQFNRSFSGPVCVVLNAKPSDAMRNRRLTLVLGDQAQDVAFGSDQYIRSYAVSFDLQRPATRFELRSPKLLPSVRLGNARQLGVGLNWMRIFAMPCSALSPQAIKGY